MTRRISPRAAQRGRGDRRARGRGAPAGEYTLNLPSPVGTHHLQILREVHGGATGYAIALTGDARVINPTPVPGVLALLGLGLVALGAQVGRRA